MRVIDFRDGCSCENVQFRPSNTLKDSVSMNIELHEQEKSRDLTSRLSGNASKAKVWTNAKNVAFANFEFNEGKYVHTAHKQSRNPNDSHSLNCSHLKDDHWNWHIPFVCCSPLSVAYGFSSDDSSIRCTGHCAVDYNSIYNCLGLNLICNHLCLASSTHTHIFICLCATESWKILKTFRNRILLLWYAWQLTKDIHIRISRCEWEAALDFR